MGKKLFFGSGLSAYKDFDGLLKVCSAAIKHGITNFDTAPSYRTEAIISKAIKHCAKDFNLSRNDYFIQTKLDPIQMYNGNIEYYFKSKLQEMDLEYIDALLIHWPLEKYLSETWDCMIKLKQEGLIKHVGICNLRLRHLETLKKQGIIPEILQIERHPLNTFEKEVEWCKKNSIIIQDYSPLCKMHPLIKNNEQLRTIALKHGQDIGSIVLRWHIETGAIPVFTSKNIERIKTYSNVENIRLTTEEVNIISKMNRNHKLYLESLICPGF